ncbi:MAG: hypothetical protein JXA57_09945 [Armatimonadetes bacterium]|nr:hypothetical protein [Armatimonadota bacterium]
MTSRSWLVFKAQILTWAILAPVLLLASEGPGQFRLVRDVNSQGVVPPGALTVAGSLLFFTAGSPQDECVLWATDGTEEGTYIVTDRSDPPRSPTNPSSLIDVDGTLFFNADGGLWKSDGTPSGTYVVKDVDATGRRNLNGILYFGGPGISGSKALWVSDGTPEGTLPFVDSISRPDLEASYSGGDLAVASFAGKTVFRAADTAHGAELWVTDGTAEGTGLIADILSGPEGSRPFDFTEFAGRLFFVASNEEDCRGLWETDGISSVRLVATLACCCPRIRGVAIELLFIDNESTLFVSDGTPEGTLPFGELIGRGDVDWSLPDYSTPPVQLHGRVFLIGEDDEHGRELWVSDGTTGGTYLVRDIMPGPLPSDPSILALALAGERVFFFAEDDVNGRELWVSDGTTDGTNLVVDLFAGEASSGSYGPVASSPWFPDGVFFVADGGSGPQLWASDGSPDGTYRIREFESTKTGGSLPSGYVRSGDKLYFAANGLASGRGLWVTDGTESGTYPLSAAILNLDFFPVGVLLGEILAFPKPIVQGHSDWALWRTDGTIEGTSEIASGLPRLDSSLVRANDHVFALCDGGLLFTDGSVQGTVLIELPAFMGLGVAGEAEPVFAAGEIFYFTPVMSDDVAHGFWRSDGTTEGTYSLPVEISSKTAVLGEWLYFGGYSNEEGSGLYRTDGTAEGTSLVRSLSTGYLNALSRVTDAVYFVIGEWDEGAGLWRSDGTSSGTLQVHAGAISNFLRVGQGLFFLQETSLWHSNGTSTGTNLVGAFDGGAELVGEMGNRLLFTTPSETACKLWISDGTQRGTAMIAELPSSQLEPLQATPDYSFFVTCASPFEFPCASRQLWVTDGTSEGTHPVSPDVNGQTYPVGFVAHYGRPGVWYNYDSTIFEGELFIAADDGVHGSELMAVPVPEIVPIPFSRGDVNVSGAVDIADAIFVLQYLFASGPEPRCLDAVDTNDDGALDMADGIYILQNLFASGPIIPPPYPACGLDPTVDALGCVEYGHCAAHDR